MLSLALAAGATSAVFSIVDTLMLRELPVRDPQQLVELLSRYPGEERMNVFGWDDYERYRDRSGAFSEIIATGAVPLEISTGRDPAATESVIGECAVGGFFQSLGVPPPGACSRATTIGSRGIRRSRS